MAVCLRRSHRGTSMTLRLFYKQLKTPCSTFDFHHCKYPMNCSCACQISVGPVNQVHVKRISWLFSQQTWLPHRETTGSIASLSGPCVSLRGSFHIEPCERFHYWRNYVPVPENLRNQPACHQVMCHKFISKKWWVWVKNSSPSSYAVSLAIIFTISRHDSPAPILEGRMYSQTEL